MTDHPLLIDGADTETGDWLEVRSPYDQRVVGRVARADRQHAESALDAAEAALVRGGPLPYERAEVLERAAVGLTDAREEVAIGLAEEAGKPLVAARSEVDRCADTLRYAAIEARTLAGSVVPFEGSAAGRGKFGFTVLKPKGVVAAITPFNFPLNLVAHKVAPAFAAGCPVVVKPASETPLSALRLARVLVEAGMPRGYLQVVAGSSRDIGPVLTGHRSVALISFTGSVEVGHQLQADHPQVPVLMELGNNTPVIVDATADLDVAASKLALTANGFAGQSCISAQRVFVDRGAHGEFVDQLVAATEALVVGDPLDEATQVGPLIREQDRARVLSWIHEAVEAGAKLRCGGEVNADGTLQPAVLDDVSPDMRVCHDEIFGPVMTVQAVDDLDEAIRLSNDSRFGLQAGIFTNSVHAAQRAVFELSYGGVTVNESPTFRVDQQPYGGLRESGNTREGPAWAVHEYLEETVAIWAHTTAPGGAG